MILNKANTSQRLVAYLIDFFIISISVSLITDLVYLIAGIDFSILEVLIQQLSMQLEEILQIVDNGGNAADQIVVLQQYLAEIMKLYGIQSACLGGVSIVVFILYMVVLPLKWSKQTIGRAIMKCKVVYPIASDLSLKECKKKTVKAFFIRELVAGWLLYYMIGSLIVIIIALVLYNKQKRTLADIISKTETISVVDISLDQTSSNFEEPVQEEPEDPFKIDPRNYEASSEKDNNKDDYIIF